MTDEELREDLMCAALIAGPNAQKLYLAAADRLAAMEAENLALKAQAVQFREYHVASEAVWDNGGPRYCTNAQWDRFCRARAALSTDDASAGDAQPAPTVQEALRPFAEIGAWLFARDLPDDTPMVEIGLLNGTTALTRGDFKAAHIALRALSESASTEGIKAE